MVIILILDGHLTSFFRSAVVLVNDFFLFDRDVEITFENLLGSLKSNNNNKKTITLTRITPCGS